MPTLVQTKTKSKISTSLALGVIALVAVGAAVAVGYGIISGGLAGGVTLPGTTGSGLVAYWDFNNLTNNIVIDLSDNKITAKVIGKPTLVAGLKNNALSLDGSGSSYIVVPAKKSAAGVTPVVVGLESKFTSGKYLPITIGFLAKKPEAGSHVFLDTTFNAVDSGFMVFTYQNNNLSFLVGQPGGQRQIIDTGLIIESNFWHHYAITCDSSKLCIFYRDGSEVKRATLSVPIIFGKDLYIGSRGDKWGNLKGQIDEVTLYNRALTAAEIDLTYRYASNLWICSESNETANNVDPATIPYYSLFVQNNGDLSQIKYFDIYNKSTAQCFKGGNGSSASDYCLIDVCSGNSCVSNKVTSCLPTDRNCRLQEMFIKNANSTSTPALSNSMYYCQNGCSNGACNPSNPVIFNVVINATSTGAFINFNVSGRDLTVTTNSIESGLTTSYGKITLAGCYNIGTNSYSCQALLYDLVKNNIYHFRIVLDRGKATQFADKDYSFTVPDCSDIDQGWGGGNQGIYGIYGNGVCNSAAGQEIDSCNNGVLIEHYCEYNKSSCSSYSYNCRFGCESTTTPSQTCDKPSAGTCYDSDGGANPDIKGYIEATFSGYGSEFSFDYCGDNEKLIELSCGINTIKAQEIACTNGKICRDGACVMP